MATSRLWQVNYYTPTDGACSSGKMTTTICRAVLRRSRTGAWREKQTRNWPTVATYINYGRLLPSGQSLSQVTLFIVKRYNIAFCSINFRAVATKFASEWTTNRYIGLRLRMRQSIQCREFMTHGWCATTVYTLCFRKWDPFLARAACLPRGLYVLLALIPFKNKPVSKVVSGSTGPIFTKFSPYGRYLIVDYRFDPFSNGSRDVAMATNFKVIIRKIGLFIFIRSHGIAKRTAISPIRHSDIKAFISCDELATWFVNLVSFGPATTEFKKRERCTPRRFFVKKINLSDKLSQDAWTDFHQIFTLW